jgi:hypothetical protein
VLRDQPGLFGEVASQPTAWRLLDEALLGCLQAARAVPRSRVGAAGLAPAKVTFDSDATLVDLHSDKEKAAPTYKKGFGYHPLLVFCDETSEAVAAKLRPGSAGANTAADHVELLDDVVAQLPVPTKANSAEHGLDVLVRAGSAGATHGFVDVIVGEHFEFSIGPDITEAVRRAILDVPDDAWAVPLSQDLEEREGAGVAELTGYLDLSAWPAGTALPPTPPGCWSCSSPWTSRHGPRACACPASWPAASPNVCVTVPGTSLGAWCAPVGAASAARHPPTAPLYALVSGASRQPVLSHVIASSRDGPGPCSRPQQTRHGLPANNRG